MTELIENLKRKEFQLKRNSQIDLNWGRKSKFAQLLNFLGTFPELLQFNLYADDLTELLSDWAQGGLNMILDEYDYLYSEWLRTLLIKTTTNAFGQKVKIYKDGTEITIGKNKSKMTNRRLKPTDFSGKELNVNIKELDNKYSNIYSRKVDSEYNERILNPNTVYHMFPELLKKCPKDFVKKHNEELEIIAKLTKKLKRNVKYTVPCIYEFVKRPKLLLHEGLDYNPDTGEPISFEGHKFWDSD